MASVPPEAGSRTSSGVAAPPARTGETSAAQTARCPAGEVVVVQRTQTDGNSERPPGGSAASSENGTDHRTSPVSGSVPRRSTPPRWYRAPMAQRPVGSEATRAPALGAHGRSAPGGSWSGLSTPGTSARYSRRARSRASSTDCTPTRASTASTLPPATHQACRRSQAGRRPGGGGTSWLVPLVQLDGGEVRVRDRGGHGQPRTATEPVSIHTYSRGSCHPDWKPCTNTVERSPATSWARSAVHASSAVGQRVRLEGHAGARQRAGTGRRWRAAGACGRGTCSIARRRSWRRPRQIVSVVATYTVPSSRRPATIVPGHVPQPVARARRATARARRAPAGCLADREDHVRGASRRRRRASPRSRRWGPGTRRRAGACRCTADDVHVLLMNTPARAGWSHEPGRGGRRAAGSPAALRTQAWRVDDHDDAVPAQGRSPGASRPRAVLAAAPSVRGVVHVQLGLVAHDVGGA